MSTLLIFFVAVVCILSKIKYNFLYPRNKVIETYNFKTRCDGWKNEKILVHNYCQNCQIVAKYWKYERAIFCETK